MSNKSNATNKINQNNESHPLKRTIHAQHNSSHHIHHTTIVAQQNLKHKAITRIEAGLLLQGGEKEYITLFTRIWYYYYPRLVVYIRNINISSPEEDLVQEILMKVWVNLSTYNPLYSLSTWIYQIARNHMRDIYRKKEVSSISMDEQKPDTMIASGIQSPEEIYFHNLEKKRITRFLHHLDDKDKEISYLRFYEQLKVRNIAKIMNMPAGTVKYRLHSIKKKLTAFLEEDNEEKK